MKQLLVITFLAFTPLSLQAQTQQPSATQVLQEQIRQENLRTQIWADRQTDPKRPIRSKERK